MKWLIALPRRGFIWLRKQAWPSYLLFRQLVRAAAQASGITITVLAAAYSIAIPYLLQAMNQGLVLTPGLTVALLLIATVLSVPLVLFSGWIALKTADPETYARILLGGRPEKEVLFTISRRIDRCCSRTLRLSTWAEEVLKDLEKKHRPSNSTYKPDPLPSGLWRTRYDRAIRWVSLSSYKFWKFLRRFREPGPVDGHDLLPPELRKEIECLVWWLRRFPHSQYTRLLRIETMKYRAAVELEIPPRRICDHLFQYSPAMHRDRLQKYVQNWGQILDSRPITEEERRRLWEMAVQNLSFLNNTRRRRRYQREILENRDLHPYVVQFASKHSTSGSLQTYAEALRFVAMNGSRRLENFRGAARKREMRAVRARLAFLHRKQRAHPGFDLNVLLLNALNCMEYQPHGGLPGVRRVLESLERARVARQRRREALPVVTCERLEAFRHLSFQLATLIGASRQEISQRVDDVCAGWLSSEATNRYIISHGYSRTVLSVLRRNLPSSGTLPDEKLPRLFFLLPDEKESFDTRVMEYELKEDRNLRSFRNFAAGNVKHLLALLKETDRVLVLLGAECFDGERNMVHPRGFRPVLDFLMQELKGRVCRVVVVAESYKRHKSSLTADTRFYSQHFDRIDLYPPELIHCIVTDEEILPQDWGNGFVS